MSKKSTPKRLTVKIHEYLENLKTEDLVEIQINPDPVAYDCLVRVARETGTTKGQVASYYIDQAALHLKLDFEAQISGEREQENKN